MAGANGGDGPREVRRGASDFFRLRMERAVRPELSPAIDSAMFDAALSAFEGYCHPTNWDGQAPILAISAELIWFVFEAAERLRLGYDVPGWRKKETTKPRRRPDMEAALRAGLVYIWAARGRSPGGGADDRADRAAIAVQLNDRDPVGTVAQAFGMSEAQVYNLISKPGFAPADPCNEYLDCRAPAARAECIRNGMNLAGGAYLAGKSKDARARAIAKAAAGRLTQNAKTN